MHRTIRATARVAERRRRIWPFDAGPAMRWPLDMRPLDLRAFGLRPLAATALAILCGPGPAHALLEIGSAPSPTQIATPGAPEDTELWLSPTDRIRTRWRRAYCARDGVDGPYDFAQARSASGTVLPTMMGAVYDGAFQRKGPVRPVRRPSYILAAELTPRDPATVRPVKRPRLSGVVARRAEVWHYTGFASHALPASSFYYAQGRAPSAAALWRSYLCSDGDGLLAFGSSGLGVTPLGAQGSNLSDDRARARATPASSRRPRGGGGPNGGLGGGPGGASGQPVGFLIPTGPFGGPSLQNPAFEPPGNPGGGAGGPNGGPLGGPGGPGGPGGSPGGPGGPPDGGNPAPVPLPAPLLLLLTACGGLFLGRRVTGAWRS